MKIFKHIFYFLSSGLLLFVLLPGMYSCETENCISVANNDLLVSFYEQDSSTVKDMIFGYVTADGTDSVFYDYGTKQASFSFPVNPADDQTLFVMQVVDTITYDTITYDPLVIEATYHLRDEIDSLWVEYRRTQRIITEDCGVEIYYSNLTVKKCTFPGYEFENEMTFLSRLNDVNIKIYD